MWKLTGFELRKIWGRRGFLPAVCFLLALNLFLLWYTNQGDENTPELSSYRKFCADIAGMSEQEKEAYVNDLKRTADGVSFVREILIMQSSKMGMAFAEQELQEHPGVFEAYYDLYESGDYLRYTDSLDREAALIGELYAEKEKVSAYASYLASVQEKKELLSAISVFAKQKEIFSSRNIRKSAEDYAGLSAEGICWFPSKAVTSAVESTYTDLLLILLDFLFAAGLIAEEKQKGLFRITCSTLRGEGPNLAAKYLALLLHCLISAALFVGANCLFFGWSAGWCGMSAKLQSLAPYMESSLPISILQFLLLTAVTKGLTLFAAGALLAACYIFSENLLFPCVSFFALWALNWCLYRFVPAASRLCFAKHINLFGFLKCGELYGGYLNLDCFGFPVSRILLSFAALAALICAGIVSGCIFWKKECRLQYGVRGRIRSFPFRPHGSLIRHEGYKICITNHALLLFLLFGSLIAYGNLTHGYAPSAQEQYYRDIMLKLQGEQTQEKIDLIEAETARYKEAFEKIEEIDAAAALGEIDEETGEAMKLKWYGVTAFYPAFQRIERQYRFVCETGEDYIYDTGYLYLLGVMGKDMRLDFLLLTAGILLAFGNVIPMEYQSGTRKLLCASEKGKHRVLLCKTAVCGLLGMSFSALPFFCRWAALADVFPVGSFLSAARCIPFYRQLPSWMPAIGLILTGLAMQMLTGLLLTAAVLLISRWRKNHAQTLFFGALFLGVPVVMSILGFEFAQWLSFYPLYSRH